MVFQLCLGIMLAAVDVPVSVMGATAPWNHAKPNSIKRKQKKTMPRISKLIWEGTTLDYGWMYDIQSIPELMEYTQVVRLANAKKEFSDAMKVMHLQGHDNVLSYLAKLKGIGLIEALGQLNSDVLRGQIRTLDDVGRLFINNKGGYFGYHRELKILETREIDVFALPGKSDEPFRIIKWDGGTHFYAKVGDEDVVVNGAQKWDTRKEAEDAAKIYIQGKRL